MKKTISNPEDLNALLARIESLSVADKAVWGQMSVQQMLCHANDAVRYVLGERKVATQIKSPMPPSLYKWIALNTPTKWPQGVQTTPEMAQGIGGTVPAEFEADRGLLIEALKALAAKTTAWPEHPMFGAMSMKEWMRWGWLHTDHHLRQFGR